MKPFSLSLALFVAAFAVLGGRAAAQTDGAMPAPARVVRKAPATPRPYVNSFPVTRTADGQAEVATPKAVTPARRTSADPTQPTARPAASGAAVPKPVLPKPPARAKVSPVNSVQTVLGTTPGPVNRTVIVLDPAHGGQDNGARLSDSLVEKDVDLAFAFKLRSLLQARGFTVLLTRDSDSPMQDADPGSQLTLDDRAGLSNHARAAACLLIHSTGSGTGVHLYHSELAATPGEAASLPWLTAQAAWVTQSQNLAAKLGQALTRGSIPLVSSAASVRPVDSLTCPALVVELAPRDSGDAETITDNDYQQSVAEALAGALVFWKNQYQPPAKMIPLEPTPLAGPVTAMGEQP